MLLSPTALNLIGLACVLILLIYAWAFDVAYRKLNVYAPLRNLITHLMLLVVLSLVTVASAVLSFHFLVLFLIRHGLVLP